MDLHDKDFDYFYAAHPLLKVISILLAKIKTVAKKNCTTRLGILILTLFSKFLFATFQITFILQRVCFFFQQDNAPPHRAMATDQFFRDRDITVPPWPPYSPDLNPSKMYGECSSNSCENNSLNFFSFFVLKNAFFLFCK